MRIVITNCEKVDEKRIAKSVREIKYRYFQLIEPGLREPRKY
jgi:hypothetical protein